MKTQPIDAHTHTNDAGKRLVFSDTAQLQPLLNEHDVARIAQLSVASIRRRRCLKLPPIFKKLGAAVRYRREDVAAWLESCPSSGGTREKGQ